MRRQVPVRLVQEDLHALRHLLLQQLCLRPVQVLRLNATSKETVIKHNRNEYYNQGAYSVSHIHYELPATLYQPENESEVLPL